MTTAYYRPQPGDLAVWTAPDAGGGWQHYEAAVAACDEAALVGGLLWAAFLERGEAPAPAALALLWTKPARVWVAVDPADPLPLYRARPPVVGLRADDDRLRCPGCRCWRSGDPLLPNSRDEGCDPTVDAGPCPCHVDLDEADAVAQYGPAPTEAELRALWGGR